MVTAIDSGQKQILQVTEDALEELRKLQATEGQGKQGVRLGVKGGGCSGFSYLLEFNDCREGDNVLEFGGIKFFMDKKSTIYLKGIMLDFKKGLKGKGFVFQNPNATSTCGCGESFSV